MTEPATETARGLLDRHGLPEDVVDGALCLHAQELAAVQRAAISKTDDPVFYDGEAGWLVSLIEPGESAAPAVVSPPTDRAEGGSGREAEAELYVLLRKAGEDRYEAQACIDRHRDEVLRRLAAETQQQPDAEAEPESCAHCGKPIRPVTGTLAVWWVHDPGGIAACVPAEAASSTRAVPVQPAADDTSKETEPGVQLDEDGRDVETGHLPGCASQSYPDPGICYCEETPQP
jgi:hypothetical protein